ncbi:MAG: hypothetical protein AAFQ17_04050 [Pseudomonadota bacterium]
MSDGQENQRTEGPPSLWFRLAASLLTGTLSVVPSLIVGIVIWSGAAGFITAVAAWIVLTLAGFAVGFILPRFSFEFLLEPLMNLTNAVLRPIGRVLGWLMKAFE